MTAPILIAMKTFIEVSLSIVLMPLESVYDAIEAELDRRSA
jgi:hypothetical protein